MLSRLPRCAWVGGKRILRLVTVTAQTNLRARFLLAALAGATLAAAFPKLGVAGLGWVAPALMLASATGLSPGAAWQVGYVAGLTHALISLHWLLFIPVRFAPVVGWLALAAYLALYPATWVWLCWRLYPAQVRGGGGLALADAFLSTSRRQRVQWALICAALWVAGEMAQARLLSGFPWNLLGASQYRMVPFLQIAPWTGVYGVSFVMTWFSVSLLATVAALVRQPERRQTWAPELMAPLLAVLGVVGFGMRRMMETPSPGPTLRVLLIQPSIPQTVIWNQSESAARFRQVVALSETALTNQADLLVWPEAAVPSLLRWDTNVYGTTTLYEAVAGLARRHGVWLILGADDAAPNPRAPDGADYFNASFLLNPQGEIVATYRKRRLVIFGEYVPLARWLPFLRTFTSVAGDFTPGQSPVAFVLQTSGEEPAEARSVPPSPQAPVRRGVKTSVLICFEDIFPHLAREHVEPDTDFLLNLTNNGWFGESAAQWQHAAAAVFRAVENGLPLVRCANNGLTCWVDDRGRMHEVFFADSSDIYRAGFKLAHVPLRGDLPRTPTFYQEHGDVFGWACVGLAVIAVAGREWRRRQAQTV